MKQLLVLVILTFVFAPSFASAFSRNLFLGVRGADVEDLQILFNRNPATQVARSGPGSPGLETQYFGPLTEDAVRRFQEVHRADILAPLGLGSPTGYFGPSSRTAASQLATTQVAGALSPAVSLPPVTQQNTAVKSASSEDPLEFYVEEVKKIGRIQGFSTDELNRAEEAIRSVAATSTNLTQLFIEQVEQERKKSERLSFLSSILSSAIALFTRPETTFAQFRRLLPECSDRIDNDGDGHRDFGTDFGCLDPLDNSELTNPFGGPVVFALPCTCTFGAVWQITVGPPRPIVSDYVIGSQAFKNFNFPFPNGIESLGLYVARNPSDALATAICQMGIPAPPLCAPIPSFGIITPITGSALRPPGPGF